MPLVKPYYVYTLPIDGEDVVFRIKRFNAGEALEFRALFKSIIEPFKLRYAIRRPDEQDRDEQGAYLILADQIADRRLHEMNVDEHAEYERREEAAEQHARTAIATIIEQYLTIERGILEELPDGTQQSVTTGADFLRLYAGQWQLLGELAVQVAACNTLGTDQKKVLSVPVVSPDFSPAPKARGRRPRTTATPAVRGASVKNAAASETPAAPSGSTVVATP